MSEPISSESLSIPSNTDELAIVDSMTERIARDMGFNDGACSDLGICVTEAVNNAIIHAHKQHPDLYVDILFESMEDSLRITVRDRGSGFNEADIPDPTLPENLFKTGGRGVHVIRSLMDHVTVERLSDGMRICMVKNLER